MRGAVQHVSTMISLWTNTTKKIWSKESCKRKKKLSRLIHFPPLLSLVLSRIVAQNFRSLKKKKSQLKKIVYCCLIVFCLFLKVTRLIGPREMRSNIKRTWTIRVNFSHSPGLSNRQNILDTEFQYGCSNRARKMELSWKHTVTFYTESFCRMRHKYPQQSLPWT